MNYIHFMNFLQFLNNGHNPYYILGHGGLNYKPPRIHGGMLNEDTEDEEENDEEENDEEENDEEENDEEEEEEETKEEIINEVDNIMNEVEERAEKEAKYKKFTLKELSDLTNPEIGKILKDVDNIIREVNEAKLHKHEVELIGKIWSRKNNYKTMSKEERKIEKPKIEKLEAELEEIRNENKLIEEENDKKYKIIDSVYLKLTNDMDAVKENYKHIDFSAKYCTKEAIEKEMSKQKTRKTKYTSEEAIEKAKEKAIEKAIKTIKENNKEAIKKDKKKAKEKAMEEIKKIYEIRNELTTNKLNEEEMNKLVHETNTHNELVENASNDIINYCFTLKYASTKTKSMTLEEAINNYKEKPINDRKKELLKVFEGYINSCYKYINSIGGDMLLKIKVKQKISEKLKPYIEEFNKLQKNTKLELVDGILKEIEKLQDIDAKKQLKKQQDREKQQKKLEEYEGHTQYNSPIEQRKIIEENYIAPITLEQNEYNENDINMNIERVENAEDVARKLIVPKHGYKAPFYNDSINPKNAEIYLKDIEELNEEEFKEATENRAACFEYTVCGPNNKYADTFYGKRNLKFIVSDYMLNNIYKELKESGEYDLSKDELESKGGGEQFPHDNINVMDPDNPENNVINEAKNYSLLNYYTMYNNQMELKESYKNELKKDMRELLEKYEILLEKTKDTAINKNEIQEAEKEIQETKEKINEITNTLTNKELFDKHFYTNKPYFGVGVTINKFNPVSVPENYVYNGPNTQRQIEIVKSNQGQHYKPIMKDRYIIKYEAASKDSKKPIKPIKIAQARKLNEKLGLDGTGEGNKKYNFQLGMRTSNEVVVYDYTNDNYINNDFILGTYKASYTYDDRHKNHLNAVLIPIEKFVIKY